MGDHPPFRGSPEPDTVGPQVRYINDGDDGDRGRVVGWQDDDVALVMWPGNDHPMEEYASDLVVMADEDDQETD